MMFPLIKMNVSSIIVMGSYFFLKEEKIDAGMFTLNKKKEMWLLDNGCSRHMIGDKRKFFNLKKRQNG